VRLAEPGEQDGGGPGGGGGDPPAGHPGPAHVPDELVAVVGGLGEMVMVEEVELHPSTLQQGHRVVTRLQPIDARAKEILNDFHLLAHQLQAQVGEGIIQQVDNLTPAAPPPWRSSTSCRPT